MSSRRIVIDITNLVDVSFVSGIQRVVREILIRMVSLRESEETCFILVAYSLKKLDFFQVPVQTFLDCYKANITRASALVGDESFCFDNLNSRDVFFDIDSVWNNRMRRSFLLPILKAQGVAIIGHIYDVIPILFPQYCDAQTTLRFMDFLGAHLQHADLLIANTESTLSDIREISAQIGTPPIRSVCVPLGADFVQPSVGTAIAHPAISAELVDPRARELGNNLGAEKYLLMVGTIEPRKNHQFVLDAYEETLRQEGLMLVIAGRPGWNVESLMRRIREFDKTDPRLLYFDMANDDTINFLYEHAFFTVFPTQYEGFGLPIIESFLHQTPVLATDIPVLHEVGGSFCDYFRMNDKADLLRILSGYKNDPAAYSSRKNELKSYTPLSWDQSEALMWAAIRQALESTGLPTERHSG